MPAGHAAAAGLVAWAAGAGLSRALGRCWPESWWRNPRDIEAAYGLGYIAALGIAPLYGGVLHRG